MKPEETHYIDVQAVNKERKTFKWFSLGVGQTNEILQGIALNKTQGCASRMSFKGEDGETFEADDLLVDYEIDPEITPYCRN